MNILLALLIFLPFSTQSAPSRYLAQAGTPAAVANFIQPDAGESGCSWSGVAGQVFDHHGNPVAGLVVEVSGTLEGEFITYTALTGSSVKLGSGGWDIALADHLISTETSLQLRLLNLLGQPQSAPISFQTHNQCDQNLVLINFTELPTGYEYYLPVISH